ncbi:hypothetical protein QD47_25065, partial [Paenibacillus terrae]
TPISYNLAVGTEIFVVDFANKIIYSLVVQFSKIKHFFFFHLRVSFIPSATFIVYHVSLSCVNTFFQKCFSLYSITLEATRSNISYFYYIVQLFFQKNLLK